jgi:hypothetical protein
VRKDVLIIAAQTERPPGSRAAFFNPTLCCPATGIWVWRKVYRKGLVGQLAGSINGDGYRLIQIDGRKYLSSRLAWLYMKGQWPLHTIDHINMIKDDDRWGNLRSATEQQQRGNRAVQKNNKLGRKGVSRVRGKFYATIRAGGKRRCLGAFATVEEAHAAYCEAAREAFGEFFRGPASSVKSFNRF